MNHLRSRKVSLLGSLLVLFGLISTSALGQSGIKINGEGTLTQTPAGPWTLHMEGTASHFGKFTCNGELVIFPGEEEGSKEGLGFAAFTAANGDVLVAAVDYHADADGNTRTHFAWRDSVTIGETVVNTTGRFVDNKPVGLVLPGKEECVTILIFTFCKIVSTQR